MKAVEIVPPGPEADQMARDLLFGLCHHKSCKEVVDGRDCLRKSLLRKCGVESPDCKNCTRCIENHPAVRAAIEAREAERKEQEDRGFVLGKLAQLRLMCAVCLKAECSGLSCFQDKDDRCFRCHGRGHQSRGCKMMGLPTNQQCCPFCLLLFDEDISDTGFDFHKVRGQCPLKDRVKRVMLHPVQQKCDGGSSALERVGPCMSSPRIWIKRMAESFREIDLERSCIDEA
jgi:hypothetical protein